MTHKTQTAEQIELRQKEDLLKQRQIILAELELTLSTISANLRQFEIEYYLSVGSKYVEIDQLQAILDKILSSKFPFDKAASKKASESQKKADQSARDAEEVKGKHRGKNKFEPTSELKVMYRELAKLLHPDLTLDETEKERRHELMQQLNKAYQNGDLRTLHDILESERNNPESITGEDIGSELVRTIRKIAQVEKRIKQLEADIESLRTTDLFLLQEAAAKETQQGGDLLHRLSVDLDGRIRFLREQVNHANKHSS